MATSKGFSMFGRRAAPRSILPTAPLPDPIGETIQTIIALQTKAERDVAPHQRRVELITGFFGRPAFLYGLMAAIALWLLPNLLPAAWGIPHFDPPPFEGLDKTISIVSLLMTAGVLVRQSRQEYLAEQRAQLSLQLNLLSEQKIAKVIALVEELRQDLPEVSDRYDPEAEVMQQAVDPQTVVETLEETLTVELARLQNESKQAES
ncbi:MAG: DUF1003 domain-containing protein [Myxacorys chilensis ATA2-1-KO14]|jgi:uncharacterized membrane protein|nr:DUF1003 domain-containing protein [Myxacorys chilensis ATA2-1-KO14]